MFHHFLPKTVWDNWSFMEQDDLTDYDEGLSVWEEVLYGQVPPVFGIRVPMEIVW